MNKTREEKFTEQNRKRYGQHYINGNGFIGHLKHHSQELVKRRNAMKTLDMLIPVVLFIIGTIVMFNGIYLSANSYVMVTTSDLKSTFKPKLTWGYYPDNGPAQYGIIMASTSDNLIGRMSDSNLITPCIAELYARKHNYAFVFVKYLQRVNNRSYGPCHGFPQWNKIPLLRSYIDDVRVIVWIDMDAVITQFNRPLDVVLPDKMPQSSCNQIKLSDMGTGLAPNRSAVDLPGASTEPFLWASRDMFPSYALNLNTAVLALRRGEMANAFLDYVWRVGDDAPEGFKKHDIHWNKKPLCRGYYGWPWEQGAVWDVLTNIENVAMLRATCMLPYVGSGGLNSIQDRWKGIPINTSTRPFVTHKPDVPLNIFLKTFVSFFEIPFATVEEICDAGVARVLRNMGVSN